MSTPYNKNLPSGQKSLPELDDDCRANYAAIEERLSSEHRFPANAEAESNQGRHMFGVGTTTERDAAIPTPQSGMLWFNTLTGTLEFHNGTMWVGVGKTGIVGEIRWLAFLPSPSLPSGWLAADGSVAAQATYPELYALLGTSFGPDAGGNFTLPNLRRNVIVGLDEGGADWATAIGETGGEKEHVLTVDEMPAHDHDVDTRDRVTGSNISAPGIGNNAIRDDYTDQRLDSNPDFLDIQDRGGDQAHENRQPYLTLYGIIYSGVI